MALGWAAGTVMAVLKAVLVMNTAAIRASRWVGRKVRVMVSLQSVSSKHDAFDIAYQ
jgi:hypothetical protein